MSKTVSFVARDELAEWLEQRADDRMKSISAVCQDIVAAEYRRQQGQEPDKPEQNPGGLLGESKRVEFASKAAADAFREEHPGFVDSPRDDARFKRVAVVADTPMKYLSEAEI